MGPEIIDRGQKPAILFVQKIEQTGIRIKEIQSLVKIFSNRFSRKVNISPNIIDVKL